MDSAHGLTTANLLAALPGVLQRDDSMAALAASVAQALSARPDEMESLRIYTRIEQLPAALLDILACDFKVDWWDTDYTLEEKRRTLAGSWHVHRKLGTKYAVESAVGAIYKGATVQEWWEYGGQPYYFRLNIQAGDSALAIEKHRQVLARIQYYKNLRSVLDAICYDIEPVRFDNRLERLRLRRILLALRVSNVRGEWVQLNGNRCLDGAWQLNQAVQGMLFRRFVTVAALRNAEKCGLARYATAGFAFANAQRAAPPMLFSVGSRFQTAVHSRLAKVSYTGIHARQTYALRGSVTMDTMYRLDGAALLHGSRKLNAGILKEDL